MPFYFLDYAIFLSFGCAPFLLFSRFIFSRHFLFRLLIFRHFLLFLSIFLRFRFRQIFILFIDIFSFFLFLLFLYYYILLIRHYYIAIHISPPPYSHCHTLIILLPLRLHDMILYFILDFFSFFSSFVLIFYSS